jgi:hypothetical protein
MTQNNKELTLEETNVSLNLADIQRRCWQLINNPDELGDLSLEDPPLGTDNTNPYDRG